MQLLTPSRWRFRKYGIGTGRHVAEPGGLRRRDFFRLAVAGTTGAAIVALKGRAAAGYGRCSACACANFIQAPYTDICQRCGHSYSAHW